MRANVVKDGNVINTIEIEADCVCITQAEADAMPRDELMLGKFYIVDEGVSVVPIVDDTVPFVDNSEEATDV